MMEDIKIKVDGKWYEGVEGVSEALMQCEKCVWKGECEDIIDDMCFKMSYIYWIECKDA